MGDLVDVEVSYEVFDAMTEMQVILNSRLRVPRVLSKSLLDSATNENLGPEGEAFSMHSLFSRSWACVNCRQVVSGLKLAAAVGCKLMELDKQLTHTRLSFPYCRFTARCQTVASKLRDDHMEGVKLAAIEWGAWDGGRRTMEVDLVFIDYGALSLSIPRAQNQEGSRQPRHVVCQRQERRRIDGLLGRHRQAGAAQRVRREEAVFGMQGARRGTVQAPPLPRLIPPRHRIRFALRRLCVPGCRG
ncbi:hypothetical protein DFJ74DRAFT_660031 [Hyaloraphidium curvatum]|nr:hypothetical protein DFJ74DRAFT_660031 [Hyaloraphidium curvatum]